MVAKLQIKRTETNDLPPTGLLPGELSVEMGVPTRLWVGVPTTGLKKVPILCGSVPRQFHEARGLSSHV